MAIHSFQRRQKREQIASARNFVGTTDADRPLMGSRGPGKGRKIQTACLNLRCTRFATEDVRQKRGTNFQQQHSPWFWDEA